jgi:hypothetical protein
VRVNRGLLGWGVFFVLLGSVPLAVRQGMVSEDSVREAWQLWPLIPIGIGIGLLLRRTNLEPLGGLIVAGTFGLMLGGVLTVGIGGFAAGCSITGGEGVAFARQSGTLDSDARVDLNLNCGELTVATAAGSDWALEGTSEPGHEPQVRSSGDRLSVESRANRGIFDGAPDRWTVTLPLDPATLLSATVNAGSGRLGLAGLRVPSVSLSLNAGDMRVDLGDAAEVGSLSASANAGSLKLTLPARNLVGSISVNAGSIDLCIPDGVGLRFRASDNLTGSNNFGSRGMAKSGDTWETPGFASSGTQIELSTSANVGSITLNPDGGCGG